MNKLVFIALSYSISLSSFATDHLMYIGVGGEDPQKETTIFDTAISNMGRFVHSSPALKVDVALNGGHKVTEEIIHSSFSQAQSRSGFTPTDYERLIENYKEKLLKGEIKNGDQFLIYIDSHGAQKKKGEETHAIATAGTKLENYDTLSNTPKVSLDQLKVLKDLAKEKGVKLAIIDNSCHSGNIHSLADESTCVISSTSSDHYGYTSFSNNFTAAMARGKNLEDIFLEVRKKHQTPSLPMISTKSGQEISSTFNKSLGPYLYYNTHKQDKFTTFLESTQGAEKVCLNNYQYLIGTLNEIEELNTDTKKILSWSVSKKEIRLDKLKRMVSDYQLQLLTIQTQLNNLETSALRTEEIFRSSNQGKTYNYRELITTNFEKIIEEVQTRMANEKDPDVLIKLQNNIAIFTQAGERKKELLKSTPELSEMLEKETKFKESLKVSRSVAKDIAAEERKLYSELYKKDPSGPNPCRDFKL